VTARTQRPPNRLKAMQPNSMQDRYRDMTKLLYWIVYHLDLGRFGPKVLDLAVRSWLKSVKLREAAPNVRRRAFGWLTVLYLEPRS
jgi:hypothetical protein